MFRVPPDQIRPVIGFPHPRGDVPLASFISADTTEFSPPAWGCSASQGLVKHQTFVFPTRVGMFRPLFL